MSMIQVVFAIRNGFSSKTLDPCLYILRFASKLEFGAKTQQVTNTALRMVQRMKRDSLHSGRRPSGLCGAALLMSARLHDYNRSIADIVKIVKVHESTMRKRLLEFGDTPSSTLTLDEFMTVDLEEEQDPPSFKMARKKDKERLQKLIEEDADNISDLQKEIESQLVEQIKKRSGSSKVEQTETRRFIDESTLGTIHQIMDEEVVVPKRPGPVGLGPNIDSIGLPASLDDTTNAIQPQKPAEDDMEVNLEDLDDDEIDSYIMSEKEFSEKNKVWLQMNEDYLKVQKEKEEQLQKEREEGKPEKKPRKRPTKRARMGPANSAGEAIEKIIQEKKISSKINYDVLKNLNTVATNDANDDIVPSTSQPKRPLSVITEESPVKRKRVRTKSVGLPFVESKQSDPTSKPEAESKQESAKNQNDEEEEEEEEDFYEEKPEETAKEMGVLQMLKQHHEDEIGGDEYGYDDYGYEEDY
ncbi:unnamed protein product [Ceutorhynchus assimilis]|uniref:Cyclin-like domain-containing protein n=1 Tax=Ceutorhynchus assimilis TaxID=467358 RepID=A0A9N9MNY9_9CUCU|nr:unnamed protein product [Ceutorhynchus assimilis]